MDEVGREAGAARGHDAVCRRWSAAWTPDQGDGVSDVCVCACVSRERRRRDMHHRTQEGDNDMTVCDKGRHCRHRSFSPAVEHAMQRFQQRAKSKGCRGCGAAMRRGAGSVCVRVCVFTVSCIRTTRLDSLCVCVCVCVCVSLSLHKRLIRGAHPPVSLCPPPG